MNDETVLTIKEIAKAARLAAEEHGMTEVLLFGSYARGEATAASDIDVTVKRKPDTRSIMVFGFSQRLSELLNKPVDCFAIEELDQGPFRYSVLQEAVVLFRESDQLS